MHILFLLIAYIRLVFAKIYNISYTKQKKTD